MLILVIILERKIHIWYGVHLSADLLKRPPRQLKVIFYAQIKPGVWIRFYYVISPKKIQFNR